MKNHDLIFKGQGSSQFRYQLGIFQHCLLKKKIGSSPLIKMNGYLFTLLQFFDVVIIGMRLICSEGIFNKQNVIFCSIVSVRMRANPQLFFGIWNLVLSLVRLRLKFLIATIQSESF